MQIYHVEEEDFQIDLCYQYFYPKKPVACSKYYTEIKFQKKYHIWNTADNNFSMRWKFYDENNKLKWMEKNMQQEKKHSNTCMLA